MRKASLSTRFPLWEGILSHRIVDGLPSKRRGYQSRRDLNASSEYAPHALVVGSPGDREVVSFRTRSHLMQVSPSCLCLEEFKEPP